MRRLILQIAAFVFLSSVSYAVSGSWDSHSPTTVQQGNGVYMNGWVKDFQNPGSGQLVANIYVDGNFQAQVYPTDYRPDLGGNWGWHYTIPTGGLSVGTHSISVWMGNNTHGGWINVTQSIVQGTGNFTVTAPPPTPPPTGSISWTNNPIHTWDGKYTFTPGANVSSYYWVISGPKGLFWTGNANNPNFSWGYGSGLDWSSNQGSYSVYVVMSGPGGSANTNTETTVVEKPWLWVDNVNGTSPSASTYNMTRGDPITAQGWAFDRQNGAPIPVNMYIDGNLASGTVTTGQSRGDVHSALGGNSPGNNITSSGWSASYNTSSLSLGSHTMRIESTNTFTGQSSDFKNSSITYTFNLIGAQSAVSSVNGTATTGQPFTPVYNGGSGSGTGYWQFRIVGQTNWPSSASATGTQVGGSVSSSWTPPTHGTYQFEIRRKGANGYADSNTAGLYNLVVKSDQTTAVTGPGNVSRFVGQSFDPVSQISGGNGTGSYQFVVANHTNWPGTYGIAAGGQGTLLGGSNTLSNSWSPPLVVDTYTYGIRRAGDAHYHDSDIYLFSITVIKRDQPSFNSAPQTISLGSPFTPVYSGVVGSGPSQFSVAGQTNWPGTYSSSNTGQPGTTLGPPSGPWTTATSWTPTVAADYNFHVRNLGDSGTNASAQKGPFLLRVVQPQPTVAADSDVNISGGITFTPALANPTGGSGAGAWQVSVGSSTSWSSSWVPTTAGSFNYYIRKLGDNNNTVSNVAGPYTLNVTLAAQNAVTITPSSPTVQAGGTLTFTAAGGSGTIAYNWSGKASGSGGSQAVMFPAEGTYHVMVQNPGSGVYGASNTATAEITVTAPPPINDADGDGLPDWWELQYGSNPAGADANSTPPNGTMTYWEAYNTWGVPNQYGTYASTTSNSLITTVNLSARAKGSGTVTVTIDGTAKTFTFGGAANEWRAAELSANPAYVTQIAHEQKMGDTTTAQVSSAGVSDFVLTVRAATDQTGVMQKEVRLKTDPTKDGQLISQLTKAELASASTANQFTFAAQLKGTSPFGAIDTGHLTSTRRLSFGLGGTRSGVAGGRIVFQNGRWFHARMLELSVLKGPAVEWCIETPLRTQVQVPAGYVDIDRTRARIALKFYRDTSAPPSSGFKDFGSATPVAAYEIQTPSETQILVQRTTGTNTEVLEFETTNNDPVALGAPSHVTENNVAVTYTQIEFSGDGLLTPWRNLGQAKETVTSVRAEQQVTRKSEGHVTSAAAISRSANVLSDQRQPIELHIKRHLGTTDATTVGAYEKRIYEGSDWWLSGNGSIYRGDVVNPDLISGRTVITNQDFSANTLRQKPVRTTNATGGESVTVYFTGGATASDPGNVGSEPVISLGEKKSEHRTFLDGTGDDLVTDYTYQSDLVDGRPAVASAITKIGSSTEVGRKTYTYATGTFNSQATITTTIREHAAAGTYYDREIRSYSRRIDNLDFRGKTIHEKRADGTQTSYAYATSNASGGTGTDHFRAVTIVGKTGNTVTNFLGISISPLDVEDNGATADEKIFDPEGRLVREATYLYTGSTFVLLSSVAHTYDNWGNITQSINDGGHVIYAATYDGLRKQTETDEQGITHTLTYDNYGRVKTSTRASATYDGNTVGALRTTYGYDLLGRVASEVVTKGDGTGESLTTSYEYDLSNRVTKRTAPGGYETNTAYTGRTKSTATGPDGGTRIVEVFKDGRAKSTTGTAVPDTTVGWTFVGGNLQRTTTTAGQAVVETTDWLGRTVSTSTGTYDGGSRVVTNTYNPQGQLVTQTTTDGSSNLLPPRRFEYNAYGELVKEGIDTDSSGGVLDGASDYGVVEYLTKFQNTTPAGSSAHWYLYEEQKTYPFAGAAAGTAQVTSQTYTRMSGLNAATFAHVYTVDADGNVTESTTAVDLANKRATVSTTTTGSDVTLQARTLNGLAVRDVNAQGHVTLHTYDALNRLQASDDPRIGSTTFTYKTGTTLVESVTTPDSRAITYGHDTAGRVSSESQQTASSPDVFSITRFTYDHAGNLKAQYGNGTNPARFVHNDRGQRTHMYTYQTGSYDTTEPTSGGTATTWSYQGSTGLLLSKTDADNKVISYTYNDRGDMATRNDARGFVTTYTYDSLGRPDKVLYNSADTPDIDYDYDRAGKLTHVTDAVGLRSFTYYETGAAGVNQSARLKSETLPAAYGSHVINHEYQFGVANRAHGAPTALKLGTGTNYDVEYAYDSKLRLNSVGYRNLTDFTYTYEANSNLIDKVSQGASAYVRDYTYETTSDRMSKSVTTWSNTGSRTIESRFGHNLAGLRNNEKLQGSDYMSTLGRASEAGVNIDYDYNDRLELDYSGKDVLASNWTVGSPHGATNRSYTYDLFGNRTADVVGSTAGAYTPNSLNEYTAAPGMGTITYDDAGNLLSDGTKTFTYDRENRVRTMTTGSDEWTYVYDYLGRRVDKLFRLTTDPNPLPTSQKKFLYDGWNLIAELNGSGTLTRTFAWGLDASGSLQGAGGVGGLLVIDQQNGTQHLPTYDGSHNVIALYNASSGAITAAYEYDPFGRVAMAAGSYAASNPFRFSTKFEDSESGLNYYGHRYYSAQLGRFINRDPIEEGGGLNLYAFTHNDGVNKWDYLGMSDDVFDRIYRGEFAWDSSTGSGGLQTINDDNPIQMAPFEVEVSRNGPDHSSIVRYNMEALMQSEGVAKETERGFFARTFLNSDTFDDARQLIKDLRTETRTGWKVAGYAVLGIAVGAAVIDTVGNLTGIKGAGKAVGKKLWGAISKKAAELASTRTSAAAAAEFSGAALVQGELKASSLLKGNLDTPIFRLAGGDAPSMGRSWTTLDPRSFASIDEFKKAAGIGDWNQGTELLIGRLKSFDGAVGRTALPIEGIPSPWVPEIRLNRSAESMIELIDSISLYVH